jgi:hypothetical protein
MTGVGTRRCATDDRTVSHRSSQGGKYVAIIGVDAHKRSHTLVAINGSGRKLAEKTSTTNSSGHLEAIRWARGKFGANVEWGG